MKFGFFIVIVLGAVAVLGTGCAYTTKCTLDPQYRTIAVSAFQNQSKEYDLQAPLTMAVIRKLTADGRLEIVKPDQADLLLEGIVTSYNLRGMIYGHKDQATQYVAVVTAGARLTDQKSGKVVWQEKSFLGETSFYTHGTGPSADRPRGNAGYFLPTVRSFASEEENRAAAEALEQLATNIFYRVVEPW